MRQDPATNSRIVLFGLAGRLADDSTRILSEQGHDVYSSPFVSEGEAMSLIRQVNADFVFCDSDPAHYLVLLDALRNVDLGLPLVVVSQQPDTGAWLEAMQAGAADFCAPPFESAALRWILESARTSGCGSA